MAIFDGAGFLRNTLTPLIGTPPPPVRRIPFTFTSTARLMRGGKLNGIGNAFSANASAERQRQQLTLIERETRGDAVMSQLGFAGVMELARGAAQQFIGVDMPVISMAVNPHSVSWSQNKRIMKRDTMGGSTYFHFTNSADQNNDILQCTFSGRTGNINTQVKYFDALKTGANYKLRVWHELYNLSREGMLLNPENTGNPNMIKGIPNQFFITYRTVLMPVQITLIGHFNTVLNFTESADQPNMVDYNMGFTVTNTYPSLDEMSKLINTSLTTLGAAKSILTSASTLAKD